MNLKMHQQTHMLSWIIRVIRILRKAFLPSLKTTLWLLKIMIPISFVVTLLQYLGVIAWIAQYLDPVFQYMGLPGASAIAFVTGASVTTYACLAVMLSMQLTMRQATILSIMVLICHALPMESAVVKRVGSKPWRMAVLRIIAAFVAAFYLNLVLPDMPQPFNSSVVTGITPTPQELLWQWVISSLKLSLMIFGIIYGLMVIQRVFERLGIMQMLTKPLRPLMRFLGLPENASYLWLVGNVLGISYGSAAMIDLEERGQITREEANDVNYHLIMNHSMLEDTLVYATAGISAWWILSTRMLFALILVWGRRIALKIFNIQKKNSSIFLYVKKK